LLAERAEKTPVPVFPNASKFRLPEDGNTPVIMVGPGTGIAPFRAFLQERKATGAKGKNWLFFGSQHQHCNYFYREELDNYQREKFLTRCDCAWSRDSAEKSYVQHKMLNRADEIWKWMEAEGAHFFDFGDAIRMAKDVDAAPRQNPFPGKLVVNRRLSSDDSEKDTRHFEIDLTGWGLNFEPGDSVAVYPTNDPNLVNEILRALGAKGDEPVPAAKTMKPFREAL